MLDPRLCSAVNGLAYNFQTFTDLFFDWAVESINQSKMIRQPLVEIKTSLEKYEKNLEKMVTGQNFANVTLESINDILFQQLKHQTSKSIIDDLKSSQDNIRFATGKQDEISLLTRIAKAVESTPSSSTKTSTEIDLQKPIVEISKFFKTLGSGIKELSAAYFSLATSSTVLSPMIPILKMTSKVVVAALNEYKDLDPQSLKSIHILTKATTDLSKSILMLGATVALLSIMPITAAGFINLTLLTIATVGMIIGLSKISDNIKNIDESMFIDIGLMSLSLVGVAISFLLIDTVSQNINWTNVGVLLTGLSISIAAFTLIDKLKIDKSLKSTSTAIGLMSLSLIGVALSFVLISAITDSIDPLSIIGFFSISIIPVLFFKFLETVGFLGASIKSTLALGIMSLGLVTLAWSLEYISKREFDYLAIGGFAIGGATLVGLFWLIGTPTVLPFLIGGALGVIVLSASVGLLAWSIKSITDAVAYMSTAKISTDTIVQNGLAIIGTVSAFASLSTLSPFILLGSAAALSVGAALQSMTRGIIDWTNLIKSNPDTKAIGSSIANFLTQIREPFAALGQGRSSSFLTSVIGIDFSESDFERGVNSTKHLGDAIQSIMVGYRAAVEMKDHLTATDPLTGDPMPLAIGRSIATFITSLQSPFALVGQGKSPSIISGIFGADFSQTDFATGVDSTLKLGTAIQSIMSGYEAASKMKDILETDTVINKDGTTGSKIGQSIASFLTSLQTPFAAMGKKDPSLFSKVFGADFGSSDFERGLEASATMGSTISTIISGIESATKITPEQVSLLGKTLVDLLAIFPAAILPFKDDKSLLSNPVLKLVDIVNKSLLTPLYKNQSQIEKSAKLIKDISLSYQSISQSTKEMKDQFNQLDTVRIEGVNTMYQTMKDLVIAQQQSQSPISQIVEALSPTGPSAQPQPTTTQPTNTTITTTQPVQDTSKIEAAIIQLTEFQKQIEKQLSIMVSLLSGTIKTKQVLY